PLTGQEYNLVAVFSASPTAFYLFNSVQFAVFAGLVLAILRRAVGTAIWPLVGAAAVFLSPAFTTSWFHLMFPERDALFYLTVFVWCYVTIDNHPRASLCLGLIAANIALYYKEPVFLALGAFALSHLVFSRRSGRNDAGLRLDWVVLASCVVFAL